mgnify:CR=1 FL=1
MTEIETECKPNLSLTGVWFTFSTGSARHELYCQQVVAFPKPEATIFEFRPGFWLLFLPRPAASPPEATIIGIRSRK